MSMYRMKVKTLMKQDPNLTELEATAQVLDMATADVQRLDLLLADCMEVMTVEQIKKVGL